MEGRTSQREKTSMAPVHNFIRWLKGKKSNDGDKAKIARLRKLPPIPTNGYEYGFRISESMDNIHETHVYEEITFEEIPENLRGERCHSSTNGITDAMQQLDFSGAKTVGTYLVVPIRKDDHIRSLDTEEYRSLYSMFPEWAKQQLKDTTKKRQGFAISRGYSVDPPIQHSNKPVHVTTNNQVAQHESRRIHANETPSILEKSRDSGNGSDDSDSDGYRRSVGGNSRSSHGDSRHSTVSTVESLSDLDIFADEINDDFDYFIIETDDLPESKNKPKHVTVGINHPVAVTTVFSKDTGSQTDVPITARHHRIPEINHIAPKDKSRKFHVEAEALIDQLYQTSKQPERITDPQTVLPSPNVWTKPQTGKTDKSTGLSATTAATSLRSRDDFILTNGSSSPANRMSCRISDFKLDRHRRRSMDFRTKPRNTNSSSSGMDFDYGGVHGSPRAFINSQSQFLADITRMNYDRQFMQPYL